MIFTLIFLLMSGLSLQAQHQKVVTHYALQDSAAAAAFGKAAVPQPWTGQEKGPVQGMQLFAREKAGACWLGSDQGAARFDPAEEHPWQRWQYFHGRRWLQDNHIQAILVEKEHPNLTVWIRTQTGISRIVWQPMTLSEKASFFEEVIEKRHVRHGFVTGCRLTRPGDLSSSQTQDDDNDGLWTAMYLAAQSYRYAVTGSADAAAKARRAFQSLLRLEEITGIPGLYARSIKSVKEPPPQGGEWHPTADGRWLWKGDTSSDESVGHYYGYALFFDLVADDREKEQVRKVIGRMTDHLLANNLNLVDLDGKPTRWGVWGMEYFQSEEGQYEKALRSLELLSFLKTTWHITGNSKYQEAYQERIEKGYAVNTLYYRRWISPTWEINFSDDELYYLSVLPLLRYETDPALRDIFLAGVRFTWAQVSPELNPLWNFFSVACRAVPMSDRIRRESLLTLRRIPLDLIHWGVENSHRQDLRMVAESDRHGEKTADRVLAPDERRMHKWNGNPYVADEKGNGESEEAPTFFLLPYWMGRYHGYLE